MTTFQTRDDVTIYFKDWGPIAISAPVVARMLPSAQFKIYENAPHGLVFTHRDRLDADLLGFLKS